MTTLHEHKRKPAPKPDAPQAGPLTAGGEAPPDARIDQLGFVDELKKKFAENLKSAVKVEMLGADEERRRGEFFEAVLTKPTVQTVDPVKFFKAFESGKITRAQFLAAIGVRKDDALKALSGDELAKISTFEPGTPALTVSKIKGVNVALIQAVQTTAAYLAASQDLHPT